MSQGDPCSENARAGGWLAWAIVAVLLIAVPFACTVSQSRAQVQMPAPAPAPVTIDCNEYAIFARRIAILRTVEAKLELVLRQVQTEAGSVPAAKVQAFQREARIVYAEGLAPAEAGFQAWRRCIAVLGMFGLET